MGFIDAWFGDSADWPASSAATAGGSSSGLERLRRGGCPLTMSTFLGWDPYAHKSSGDTKTGQWDKGHDAPGVVVV
jgi:hypothetical protein